MDTHSYLTEDYRHTTCKSRIHFVFVNIYQSSK